MALSDGLVSYYKFEESSGAFADSVGSNDLTNSGAAYQSTGISNYCADFESGDSDYAVDSSTTGLQNDDYTFNIWVKIESAQQQQMVHVGTTDNQFVRVEADGTLLGVSYYGAGSSNNNIAGGTNLGTGSWRMVTFVRDTSESKIYIYVDGSSDGTPVALSDSSAAYGDSALTIGRRPSGVNYFDGLIDEVGIWNRALSSSEISELWNSGSGSFYPFSIDVTINPTALALTATLNDPSLSISSNIAVAALSLSMVRGSPDPTIFKMPSVLEITSSLNDPEHAVKQLPTTQALSTTNPTPQNLIVLVASLKMALAGTIPKPNIRRNFSRNWRSAWGRKHKAGLPSSLRVLR